LDAAPFPKQPAQARSISACSQANLFSSFEANKEGRRRISIPHHNLPPRSLCSAPFQCLCYHVPLRGTAAATTPVREATTRARTGAATRFMVLFFFEEREREEQRRRRRKNFWGSHRFFSIFFFAPLALLLLFHLSSSKKEKKEKSKHHGLRPTIQGQAARARGG
jgi:hypothetical protein